MERSPIPGAGQKRTVMVIRKLLGISAATGLAVLATAQSALAFDPDKAFNGNDAPQLILKYGYNALKEGRHEDAIGAFRHGAVKNHLQSQWKLARMMQLGQGVPQDDLAAYEMFEKIADRYSEIPPNRDDKPYVSNAVVSLGLYSLTGIEGTNVKRNPQLAEFHFHRAGALYGDPEAQYQLGMLYNSKLLGKKRPRHAARWLELASKKGHADAQAVLGDMLFYGKGVRKNRVRALVYLTKAVAGSARDGLLNVRDMQINAFAKASVAQRKAASQIIANLKLPEFRESENTPSGKARAFGLSADVAKPADD